MLGATYPWSGVYSNETGLVGAWVPGASVCFLGLGSLQDRGRYTEG